MQGNATKLAWHVVISGNAAFSVGALQASSFSSAASCMHENKTDPLTVNSTGTSGGNLRRCSMMSPQGIIVVLDGAARTLSIHKASSAEEARLGAPVQVHRIMHQFIHRSMSIVN